MRYLDYELDGQTVKRAKTCDFSNLIRGSSNYLALRFALNGIWQNMVCAVAFVIPGQKDEFVPVVNGIANIPDSAAKAKYFIFYVVGQDKNGVRVKTSKEKLVLE